MIASGILGLLPKPSTERKILVAYIGGADSMVLVHVLLSLNENIAIAHCNFNLRRRLKYDEEVKKFCPEK